MRTKNRTKHRNGPGRTRSPRVAKSPIPTKIEPTGAKSGAGTGRPYATSLPIYDSMQQASARTGIPVSVLKAAKAAGCPAFKWNRVELAGFLSWWFGQREAGANTDWGREWKMVNTLIARIDLAERNGEIVETDRMKAWIDGNQARVRAIMDAAFRSELPARQGGLPSDQIAKMNSARLDEIYALLAKYPNCK